MPQIPNWRRCGGLFNPLEYNHPSKYRMSTILPEELLEKRHISFPEAIKLGSSAYDRMNLRKQRLLLALTHKVLHFPMHTNVVVRRCHIQ